MLVRQLAPFHQKKKKYSPSQAYSSVICCLLVSFSCAHNSMKYVPLVACLDPFFSFIFIAVYYAVTMKYSHIATWQAITMNRNGADLRNEQLPPIFLALVGKLK